MGGPHERRSCLDREFCAVGQVLDLEMTPGEDLGERERGGVDVGSVIERGPVVRLFGSHISPRTGYLADRLAFVDDQAEIGQPERFVIGEELPTTGLFCFRSVVCGALGLHRLPSRAVDEDVVGLDIAMHQSEISHGDHRISELVEESAQRLGVGWPTDPAEEGAAIGVGHDEVRAPIGEPPYVVDWDEVDVVGLPECAGLSQEAVGCGGLRCPMGGDDLDHDVDVQLVVSETVDDAEAAAADDGKVLVVRWKPGEDVWGGHGVSGFRPRPRRCHLR